MNLFDGYSSFSGGRLSKRLMAALIPVCLLALLVALAACGGDDDDDDGSTLTGSPSQTAASSADASDTGGAGSPTGQASPTPTNGPVVTESPQPIVEGSGTAIIDGVQYDFAVNSCAIQPAQVVVIGGGLAPDGRPFLATITWYEQDYLGNMNAIEMGIGTNAQTLFDLPEQVYKLGNHVAGSTLTSLELEPTVFSVTASGNFVDLQAADDPPVEGSFTISCTAT